MLCCSVQADAVRTEAAAFASRVRELVHDRDHGRSWRRDQARRENCAFRLLDEERRGTLGNQGAAAGHATTTYTVATDEPGQTAVVSVRKASQAVHIDYAIKNTFGAVAVVR